MMLASVRMGPKNMKSSFANKTEELQSTGIKIQSVFGNVLTARLTLPELRKILSLPSVRSVENGSKNYLH